MSFAREKRLLVGWLALLAPVPLPFNEVLEWPVLWLYLVAVIFFLRRAGSDPASSVGGTAQVAWLPNWSMNLLGLAYIPVLYLDFATRWTGQLVRPVVHLALFAVVVKLFALRREKDKWQVLFGVFFLFLAAMATSVHPAVLLYAIGFLAVTLVVLTRFSLFSVLARFGYREWSLQKVPLAGFVVAATIFSIALGIPLFAVLPRIKSPFIMGRGVGTGTVIRASGFSDQVSLDSIGAIRQSREVALRLAFEPESKPNQEVRLKASTYEVYDGRSWRQSAGRMSLTSNGPGTFSWASNPVEQWVNLWLQPLSSKSLPLPVQATAIEMRASVLSRDRGGAVSMLFPPSQILEYRVALSADGEVAMAAPPDLENPAEPTLDQGGITPAVRDYTAGIVDGLDGLERLRTLESHLSAGDFVYTTELVGRTSESPIEEFLLTSKQGHCEYFASSLVVMLRSQGTPARLVTGFLGAEESRFEKYYVVRQSNAHAWVEAYLPGEGWLTLDPTPPSGRPGVEVVSFGMMFGQMWDYISFRWDRYVLTFGFYDQYQIASKLRSLWQSLLGSWQSDKPDRATTPIELPVEVPDSESEGDSKSRQPVFYLMVGALWIILLLVMAGWWVYSRQPLTPTRAYLRLRDRLAEAGLPVGDALAPLAFQQQATERFPDLAAATSKVTQLYLREAFGAEESIGQHTEELKQTLAQVDEGLRRAG